MKKSLKIIDRTAQMSRAGGPGARPGWMELNLSKLIHKQPKL